MESGENYVPTAWRAGKTTYPLHGERGKLRTHCMESGENYVPSVQYLNSEYV
jgi:hypothetical protein